MAPWGFLRFFRGEDVQWLMVSIPGGYRYANQEAGDWKGSTVTENENKGMGETSQEDGSDFQLDNIIGCYSYQRTNVPNTVLRQGSPD